MMALAMLVALAIDAQVGWPDRLFRAVGHPVVWMGRLISALERRFNTGSRGARIAAGALTVVMVCGLSGGLAALVAWALPAGWVGAVVLGVLAWPFVAARSLHDHVDAVAQPLAQGDLAAARQAVAMIVGRDVTRLDTAGVARAGIESLSENASDGVIAPLFWGLIAGLPGIVIYKAINTMDSMIGHRSDRYEAFGKAAARIDDVANLLPARLTGGLIALWGGRPAWRVMWRDAGQHRSPNAGWPEGAMAGAIGVRLSGPRVYETHVAQEPWLNAEGGDADGAAMVAALAMFRRAVWGAAGVLGVVMVLALAGGGA
ncbi:adenosylcobinamide-phosphate synthase CbiB [Sagittula sp. SSi028]|uniref:adenosylcobinamide-phosphate synthase CbiB n=1 Tax=Sagittula sp. SSi028 TaxID=3400636 RepID=UPI003AF7D763